MGQGEGILYNDYLSQYRNEILDKLTRESDSTKFYRLQGSLEVINTLLDLRGEVDLYISSVASGKMRKIELEKENQDAVGQQTRH
jgi:hypothetical protein